MEFKSFRNIESPFRQIRPFGIVFLSLCAMVTMWGMWSSYRFAEKQREKIYVLGSGKSLMLVLSQDLSQDCPAEARERVCRFHETFFTLSPEKSAIEHNVRRALLLADKSMYHYYSGFAKKGCYNRIIAGNINQVLKVDSMVCDFNAYPYRAVTYAIQKIIRQNNVTERSLVTTCRLLNTSRSDDNPNGFATEGFTTIENKDLQTIRRQQDMKGIRKPIRGMCWKLHDKRKRLAISLRGHLNGLPPEIHRRIVLGMFATFAMFALYAFGRAAYDIGRNDGSHMEMGRVGRVELPTPAETGSHLTPYLYGTDKG